MKKMFLVFSHSLTQSQREDAVSNFGIDEFVTLPDELKKYGHLYHRRQNLYAFAWTRLLSG